jgi:ankyrin repeat protein
MILLVIATICWFGFIQKVHAGWPSKPHHLTKKQALKKIKKLHDAIDQDDKAKVESILAKHHDIINKPSKENVTALNLAIEYGCIEIARILIHAGANINAYDMTCKKIFIFTFTVNSRHHIHTIKNNCGMTPLFIAICNNDINMARLLLENGADTYIHADNKKLPPLLLAAVLQNNTNMTQLLIDYHAPIDTPIMLRDRSKQSFLSLATIQGHQSMINLLLRNGADINGNKNSPSSLYKAVEYNHAYIVRLLLAWRANANIKDDNGNTPLHITTSATIARFLIEHGADVNAYNRLRQTPLHAAAFYGSGDIIDILVTNNADPMIHDGSGRTPIQKARIMGHHNVVRKLAYIQNKNALIKDEIKTKRPDILLKEGAQLNAIMSYTDHEDIQTLLNSKRNALVYRYAYCHNIMQKMIETYKIPHSWFFHAIQCAHYTVLELLCKQHSATYNINTIRETNGNGILHVAAAYYDAEMFHYLLKWDANPRHINNIKQDPYEYARVRNNKEVGRVCAQQRIVNRILEHARHQYHKDGKPDIGMLPPEITEYITRYI